jgi:hypothetical protein
MYWVVRGTHVEIAMLLVVKKNKVRIDMLGRACNIANFLVSTSYSNLLSVTELNLTQYCSAEERSLEPTPERKLKNSSVRKH